MYKFKEQYRDAKIGIPSLRLVVTSENVNQWAELIYKEFPQHKEMIEFAEDDKKEKVKGIEKIEEPKLSSTPKDKD